MATSNEDFLASDELEESEPIASNDFNCPLCLTVFKSPRRLPCSHSFCQRCIQSHISNRAFVKDHFKEFCCPICGNMVRSEEESSLDRWVYSFPQNSILHSVLMKSKVKVDIFCDTCLSDDIISPAERFCVVCEEAMCGSCLKIHRIQRMLKTHTVLKIDELASKQDIVLQNAAEFLCTEHSHSIELYCRDHATLLCPKCFLTYHKNCSEVVDITSETPSRSETLSQIKKQIKELEDHIKIITDIRESNLSKLQSQIDGLVSEVSHLREKINYVLNDLERRIRTEGLKIYNKEKKRIQELNQDCQSKKTAIKTSIAVMESASKCATQSQMLQLAKRIIPQLSNFKWQIQNIIQKDDILTLQLNIHSNLKTIADIPRGEIAKLSMKRHGEIPEITDGFKPLKNCKAEITLFKEIKVTKDKAPHYSGVTFTYDSQVLLTDNNNKICYLLNSLFNVIASFLFPNDPFDVCMIQETVVAVSLPKSKSLHILSLKDDLIKPIKQIPTRYDCYGIVAYSADEIIVSGPCGDGRKYFWSLITLNGNEKSYHEFDGNDKSQTHMALNAFKTHLYISVYSENSLHCFGLDGHKYFTFKHHNVVFPQGVAIDRDDNLYLVAYLKIFQISPDGSLVQTVVKERKDRPVGICFDKNGERFVVTKFCKKDILTEYTLKDKDG